MKDSTKKELEELAVRLERAALQGGIESLVGEMPAVLAADEPIAHAGEDRLNRVGFAGSIATAILGLKTEESLVIGIHGPWGSGKTSLLNLIREQIGLKAENPPLIMQFNPWGFSDQEQLTSQYFNQLAVFFKLHNADPILGRIADAVQDYGDLLDPVARLLTPRLREAATLGQRIVKALKPPKRTAVDLKSEISSALRRSQTRLIVIIDDIDRLNRTEIRQVFQLVKVNANFANTIYLVSFDLGPVEKALRFVAPAPPRQYLYKIIQVAFSLPPVSEAKLTELLLQNFNETFSAFGVREIDSQRFGNMLHSGFRACFHNLRDVNRYFNLYRFALGLVKDDTNPIDLAAIQCLATFQTGLYSGIGPNSALFIGRRDSWERPQGDEDRRKALEELFELVPAPDREAATELCGFLFPRMQSVFGGMHVMYEPEQETAWQKGKHVASAKYFPYYFQLAVPETDVSQREMDAALPSLKSVDSFVSTLEHFEKSGRLAEFIGSLQDQVDKLTPSDLNVIMESVFIFGDRVSTEGKEGLGLISDHVKFAGWLLWSVVDSLEKEVRFQQLTQAMTGKPAVYTIADVTMVSHDIVEKKGHDTKYQVKYPDLTPEIVQRMRRITADAIMSAAKRGTLQDAPRLPFLLYRWKDWGNGEGLSRWVQSTFLGSPAGAVQLIAKFSQTVRSYGFGDKVARTSLSVDPAVVCQIVDLDTVTGLLERARDDELSSFERDARVYFLKAVARYKAGEDPGALDLAE